MKRKRMDRHKAVFESLSEGVAPTFLQRGFVRHPAYEDGWDPYNRDYTINQVMDEFDSHIHQLKITYWPQDPRVGVEIIRSENSFAIRALEDFPRSPDGWTDLWLYQPFTTFRLRSGNSWNPLSVKNAFKVRVGQNRDPNAELGRLVIAINKKVPYLFDAMTGLDCKPHVDTVHQHIARASS